MRKCCGKVRTYRRGGDRGAVQHHLDGGGDAVDYLAWDGGKSAGKLVWKTRGNVFPEVFLVSLTSKKK